MQEINLQLNGGYKLTDNTRQRLYQDLLSIQRDIMNILLVDLNAGKELMNKYNSLVSVFDERDEISVDLMSQVIDLENEVKGAKKNTSKAKVKEYANKCEELLLALNEGTINQTQESLESLIETFKENSGDFTLEEVSKIENIFAELRFFIIREKIKTNSLNLHREISEEEIKGLESIFSYEAIKLLNSEDQKEKSVGEQIRNDLALLSSSKNSIVYNEAIWHKFASVSMLPQDKDLMVKTTNMQTKANSLALVTYKTSIWDKIKNNFKKLHEKRQKKT